MKCNQCLKEIQTVGFIEPEYPENEPIEVGACIDPECPNYGLVQMEIEDICDA
jgi:hypothetical protein